MINSFFKQKDSELDDLLFTACKNALMCMHKKVFECNLAHAIYFTF